MTKVFIDGSAGTTGLRIYERLSSRTDIQLMTLTGDLRKDPEARREMLNKADIAFLLVHRAGMLGDTAGALEHIVVDGGVRVWGNILFLGCVASMLCFLGWNWCLVRLGTVRATNFLYLNPVVAILSSTLVLGERVTWIAISGAVLILAGLVYIDKHRLH